MACGPGGSNIIRCAMALNASRVMPTTRRTSNPKDITLELRPEYVAEAQARHANRAWQSEAQPLAVHTQRAKHSVEWENVPIGPRTMPVVAIGSNRYS